MNNKNLFEEIIGKTIAIVYVFEGEMHQDLHIIIYGKVM